MDKKESLYSLEMNGEKRYYRNSTKMSLNSLFDTAIIKGGYQTLAASGERITPEEYARIEQSSKFTYSVDINFDEKLLTTYKVTGSVSEAYRDFYHISIKEYTFDELRKKDENLDLTTQAYSCKR